MENVKRRGLSILLILAMISSFLTVFAVARPALAAVPAHLYVGGYASTATEWIVDSSDVNKYNLTVSGNVLATFDTSSNTLTLKDDITGESTHGTGADEIKAGIIWTENTLLTVVVAPTTGDEITVNYGIHTTGALTIQGSGVTLNSGTTTSSVSYNNNAYGIRAYAGLTVSNVIGNVTVNAAATATTGTNYGISCNNGGITVNSGCTLTGTGDGGNESVGIHSEHVMTTEGTVVATASTGTASNTGLVAGATLNINGGSIDANGTTQAFNVTGDFGTTNDTPGVWYQLDSAGNFTYSALSALKAITNPTTAVPTDVYLVAPQSNVMVLDNSGIPASNLVVDRINNLANWPSFGYNTSETRVWGGSVGVPSLIAEFPYTVYIYAGSNINNLTVLHSDVEGYTTYGNTYDNSKNDFDWEYKNLTTGAVDATFTTTRTNQSDGWIKLEIQRTDTGSTVNLPTGNFALVQPSSSSGGGGTTSYTVTPSVQTVDSAGADINEIGGTITPSTSGSFSAGSTPSYTFTANAGYTFKHLLINGTVTQPATAGTYTFAPVYSSQSITAVFEKGHTITSTTETTGGGNGGSITPVGDIAVPTGGEQTFTFTPNEGYEISAVEIDGTPIDFTGNSYTFENVTGSHTIKVVFAPESHRIDATWNDGGKISELTRSMQAGREFFTVANGGDITLSITPEQGYFIEYIQVDDFIHALTLEQRAGMTHTLENVTADSTIHAEFAPMTFEIRSSSSAGGYITPAGTVTVQAGSMARYDFGAYEGYKLSRLVVDGVSQILPTGNVFYFTDVQDDHTIYVEYALATPIAPETGDNATILPWIAMVITAVAGVALAVRKRVKGN